MTDLQLFFTFSYMDRTQQEGFERKITKEQNANTDLANKSYYGSHRSFTTPENDQERTGLNAEIDNLLRASLLLHRHAPSFCRWILLLLLLLLLILVHPLSERCQQSLATGI